MEEFRKSYDRLKQVLDLEKAIFLNQYLYENYNEEIHIRAHQKSRDIHIRFSGNENLVFNENNHIVLLSQWSNKKQYYIGEFENFLINISFAIKLFIDFDLIEKPLLEFIYNFDCMWAFKSNSLSKYMEFRRDFSVELISNTKHLYSMRVDQINNLLSFYTRDYTRINVLIWQSFTNFENYIDQSINDVHGFSSLDQLKMLPGGFYTRIQTNEFKINNGLYFSKPFLITK